MASIERPGQDAYCLFLMAFNQVELWGSLLRRGSSGLVLAGSLAPRRCGLHQLGVGALVGTLPVVNSRRWYPCCCSRPVETPAFSHAQMRAHTHDVQTPLPLTPTTKTVVGVPPSVKQKVTWKDALFPRVVPTRVQCIPQ